MAYEGAQLKLGQLTAAADLSTKQFQFVKLASSTTVDVCDAITDVPIGVLQNTPKSGQAAEVTIFGITKVVAGGNLVAGNIISVSTGSKAVAVTRGSATTTTVLGQAIEAGGADEIVTMFLNPSNARAA